METDCMWGKSVWAQGAAREGNHSRERCFGHTQGTQTPHWTHGLREVR